MKLATREQIAKIDNLAVKNFGFTKESLVELAGQALTSRFKDVLVELGIPLYSRIGVWCGPGLNGADGREMVRNLLQEGFDIQSVEGTQWDILDYDVIVDAVFGVGLNREVKADLSNKIREVNASRIPVIAVDIPSGLDANTGVICGASLKARATLTLYPAKPGLFLNEGPSQAGQIFLVPMDLPKELFNKEDLLDIRLIQKKTAQQWLPVRSSTSNKSSFGHLLVIAGSAGMEGAAAMVCEAAARMGCGYVTLCSRSAEISSFVKPDYLRLKVADLLKNDLKKYSAVVIGPGLGKDAESLKILEHVYKTHPKVLVDADGLSLLAESSIKTLPKEWVLTPHAGELSRLTGINSKTLEANRFQAASEAQKHWQAVVLFKGFRTVLRDSKESFVIYSGNVALAKAGTGDILAGFIGSLMAQGLPTMRAAGLGAYLHGRIADEWLEKGGSTRSLMASDLPRLLDATLSRLKKNA